VIGILWLIRKGDFNQWIAATPDERRGELVLQGVATLSVQEAEKT
jgi:hypothetical protein